MAQMERVGPLVRQALTLRDEQGRTDLWLLEHSERVVQLSRAIAELPELQGRRMDLAALELAALCHDLGWAIQVQQGRFDRWQVLSRPTSDLQRELAAGWMVEQLAHLLSPDELERATETVRVCNNRTGAFLEARLLNEAENLDDIGLLHVLRQFRQVQAEGRPLEQLVSGWQRQQEYQYWEARINDCLRFEATRRLARRRLADVDGFIRGLAFGLDPTALARAAAEALPE
ncbi:MAG: HD domain-containing protein [Phycisphaerales bacterium]|nr:HD domain-containing protein [Phycisphaerales bacterium]